ncbi:MAG: C39 family peptidase [Clostridium sp.]
MQKQKSQNTSKISKTKTLYKGETYKPAITYGPNQGTAKWSSSKKSVAKVNSKGQITAVKKGTAYITVKINGKSAKQKITVKNAITLKKPQITSVKKASRASLKISWKKVSGANKYYLYRSTTKKGKKTKVATVKGTTYTHKYIAGRRYYYHVKAASTNKYKYKTSGYSAAKYGKSADTMTVSTPYINQVQGGAVQGCEGASLLMALKAKGYTNMGYRDFLNGMPTSKNNPREGFIYSMFSNNPTNQVHWIDTPALAAYGKKFGKVEDISGASISKLKYEINRNRPVVVYVTAMFNTPQWKKYSYGSIPKNLHVVTLVGYNGRTGKYKINDPYFGVLWISKGQFENVYNSMKKAVVVR